LASNVIFNAVSYSIPAEGDTGWGPDLTAYLISIASNAFQKTGGSFFLTSEANFGNSFGVSSLYLKSRAANPSSTGVIRLGSTQSVSWRNNANNADLALTTDASDNLLYNSKTVLFSGLGLIVNADVSNSAAIAYSKLAALTASRALVSDGSGVVAASSVTATELGYLSGVSSAIQTQIDSKQATITGAASTVVSSNLTASRVVISNVSGKITTTNVTHTEVDYVSGVTGQLSGNSQSATLQNKTLDNSNIVTVRDDRFTIQDNSDATKQAMFELSGITTATTRTYTLPNLNGELAVYTAPTVQSFTSGSGTYTTPANVKYIKIKMVGGAGGGGGSGTGAGATGNGGNTTFGTSLLTASGGSGATTGGGGAGGGGGGTTINSPAVRILKADGATGQYGSFNADELGGGGGVSPLGGAGRGGGRAVAGQAATTNSGSGGGGGGGFTGLAGAGGGGAGGYIESLITSPSATYAYAIGSGGSGGSAGTSGYAGGLGGSGYIVVEEYYN
jgi:hypothetical protein